MLNRAVKLAWSLLTVPLAALPSFGQSTSTNTGYVFTRLAGTPNNGGADGTGSAAHFYFPSGAAVDGAGNIYVADSNNHTIRRLTPAGVGTTLAGQASSPGSADGSGGSARFNAPFGVAADSAGNLYVADTRNNSIRKVTPAGVVTTLAGQAGNYGAADGAGSDARFNYPSGVAVDLDGNVYVADTGNATIRRVTPAGVVTTLAGLAGAPGYADGTGSVARFWNPFGVAVDQSGNVIVADTFNDTIRKVTPGGVVTTLAGLAQSDQTDQYGRPIGGSVDGVGSNARFYSPSGVALDGAGNVFVADTLNNVIRKLTPAGLVTTLAGRAGFSGNRDDDDSAARFYEPSGLGVDAAGNVIVADSANNTIRSVTPGGTVTTLAGQAGYGSADGTGDAARFYSPSDVAADSAGNVYVADASNETIRKVTSAGTVTTLAGLAGVPGSADGAGTSARFGGVLGVAVDGAGAVYVADTGNFTIRKISPAGVVNTLAGLAGSAGKADGTGPDAAFWNPFGLAVDNAGNVFVADTFNQTIRKVTPAGAVTTLAGLAGTAGVADGTGSAARFYYPSGVATDNAGNVFVADTFNQTIRQVTPDGAVTTLAGQALAIGSADGSGSAARFNYPRGVAVDALGNLYIADTFNHTIRRVTPSGATTTLAGLATYGGSADGTGSAAQFADPTGVTVDGAGNIYVADNFNQIIRKGIPIGSAKPTLIVASGPNFGFNAGRFGFSLTGQTGSLVVVETSTDLAHWLPVWTNRFSSGLVFTDPQNAGSSYHFYRARSP